MQFGQLMFEFHGNHLSVILRAYRHNSASDVRATPGRADPEEGKAGQDRSEAAAEVR